MIKSSNRSLNRFIANPKRKDAAPALRRERMRIDLQNKLLPLNLIEDFVTRNCPARVGLRTRVEVSFHRT